MRIIITGASGFIGRQLVDTLVRQPTLTDDAGNRRTVEEVMCLDLSVPEIACDAPFLLRHVQSDLSSEAALLNLVTPDVGVVFHLASVVSAVAENDFDLGMAVNLDGTRRLLEACRRTGSRPRFVLASSVAVFGGGSEDVVTDATSVSPRTSYGAQKAICELLVGDYSRKGYVEGCALRLPTVIVRPGKPNGAASTFASSIIREPLHGIRVNCPVAPQTALYVSSPRTVVSALLHAAELPLPAWSAGRTLNLPGIRVTVAQLMTALAAVAGTDRMDLISWERDPFVEEIVSRWPSRFAPTRARSLGFLEDADAEQIVRQFVEDHMTASRL